MPSARLKSMKMFCTYSCSVTVAVGVVARANSPVPLSFPPCPRGNLFFLFKMAGRIAVGGEGIDEDIVVGANF